MARAKITIDGNDYEVPAVTLGQLRRNFIELLRAHDAAAPTMSAFDMAMSCGTIVAKALMEKYPNLTEEQILDAITIENISDIWITFLGRSGFKSGEETAANQTGT